MKDEKRNCVKCGFFTEPKVTLYRFPNPGPRNILRSESWAKYCYPEEEWSSTEFQKKLFSSHKMLCEKHFKNTAFIDVINKKLFRCAVPEEIVYDCGSSKKITDPLKNDHTYAKKQPQVQEDASAIIKSTHRPSNLLEIYAVTKNDSGDNLKSPLPKEDLKKYMLSPPKVARKRPITPEDISGNSGPLAGPSGPKKPNTRKETIQENSAAFIKDDFKKSIDSPPKVATKRPMTTKDISGNTEQSGPSRPKKPNTTRDPIQKKSTATVNHPARNFKTAKEKLETATMKEKLLYEKCRKNMKELSRARKKIQKLKKESYMDALFNNKDVQELVKNKMSNTFAVLLQAQLRNYKKQPRGRRWTRSEKIIALRMYKRSPACYRLLRRIFCLPTQSTLKSLLANLPLRVGINEQIFTLLNKITQNDQPKENQYILMFDEMSIKKNLSYNPKTDAIEGYQDHGLQGRTDEIASHALVFMICGIRKKMKQPICYYFSGESVTADRLAVLIKEVLSNCFKAGVNVSATVCDMDGVNKRALGILGSSVDHPSFFHERHEVVAMFDSPHLLKCFRNVFLKYNVKCHTDIHSDGSAGIGIAKWSHIKDFYETDNSNPNFVFAPALRREHLNPNSKQKMKVSLAAQVLSHTVAAGMFAKISKGQLPTEATITATVVAKVDKLFDAVNADTPDLKRGKPFSTNLTNRSPHIEYFKEMKLFFKNIEFLGCKRRPPSQDGWIQTLNAIEKLWHSLTSKHPTIKSLCTRRLQQDPLENTFGCIRGNCGSNANPTVGQFIGGLKTAILSNLEHVGVGRNCENDNNVVLNNFEALLTPRDVAENAYPSDELFIELNCLYEDTANLCTDDGEIQACAYVCGFINKRLDTNCSSCKRLLTTDEINNVHTFIEFKEYKDYKKSLTYSTTEFINSVEFCATYINKFLEKNAHRCCLRQRILNSLKNNDVFRFLRNCAEALS